MKLNHCGLCNHSQLDPLYEAPAGWTIKVCLSCCKALHKACREGWNAAVAERTGLADPHAADWGAEVRANPNYHEPKGWVVQ